MPVFLLLMDGFFNLSAMEQPPSCYKLSEFNWMVENICPIFDGSNVIVHAFTCLYMLGRIGNAKCSNNSKNSSKTTTISKTSKMLSRIWDGLGVF